MKKLSQILENMDSISYPTQSPLIDNVGLVLSYLEQISEMADEIYNTVSQLSEVDSEAHTLIQNVYTNLDDAYAVIDNKYDIEPIGDFDEMEESYEAADLDDDLDEAVITDYNIFKTQHKKMYPSHNEEQIKAAWKKYSAAFDSKNEDNTLDESWVVYDKNTKSQIKPFKTRKGAYDYAAKSGGVVYSAEYYADNKDNIKSGKLIKEAVTKIDAAKITAAQIEKYIDNQDFEKLSEISKHLTKDEYKTWSSNGYEGRTYELLMKKRAKNEEFDGLAEEFDATKFKSFVNQTGLVSKENAADVITAMKALDSGKVLSTKQKDLINGMLMSLVGIITGDTSVFNKIKQSAQAE